MARNGGARAGAGRPMGSLGRKSVEILSEAASAGVTPVEFMLQIMRSSGSDAEPSAWSDADRKWAAEKAAPYIHGRPAPIAHKIKMDLPDTGTAAGVVSALARVSQAVSGGEIAPSEAASLVSIIDAQRKAIETGDLIERIERLEAANTAVRQ